MGVFVVVVVTEWRTTLERLTAAKTDTEFTEEKMGHGRELFFFLCNVPAPNRFSKRL